MDASGGFITGNIILDLAMTSWFFAQSIKFILELLVHRKFDITKFWSSGGMPSSHSSFVCSCVSSVGMIEGVNSTSFALASILSLVVMYDACHVRLEAGEQAKMLNVLKNYWTDLPQKFRDMEFKELLGHTPLQVMSGAGLGLLTGFWGVIHLTG